MKYGINALQTDDDFKMSDHLSDCSDDSFEIISHEPFEEPENEIVPFYKPKVTFQDVFDVYPNDSDIVARISFIDENFEKSPDDKVIIMPLAWTSLDQELCSVNVDGGYVKFDVKDLPKSSADKLYQLCYCSAKNKTIEGVSIPFSFREVHEDELIEFQKEQNKEFWTFRSRFAVLMNIYWNSFNEGKKANLLEDSVAKSKESILSEKSFPDGKISMENKEELVNVPSEKDPLSVEKDSVSAEKDEDNSVVQDKKISDEKQSISNDGDDLLVDDEKTSYGKQFIDDRKADYMVDGSIGAWSKVVDSYGSWGKVNGSYGSWGRPVELQYYIVDNSCDSWGRDEELQHSETISQHHHCESHEQPLVEDEENPNEKASSFVDDKNDSTIENERSSNEQQSCNDSEKITHENNNIIKSPQMVFECVPIESGSEVDLILKIAELTKELNIYKEKAQELDAVLEQRRIDAIELKKLRCDIQIEKDLNRDQAFQACSINYYKIEREKLLKEIKILEANLLQEKVRYECLETQFRDYERENVELKNKLTVMESEVNAACDFSDDLIRSQEYNRFLEGKITLQKMDLVHLEEMCRKQEIHIEEVEKELQRANASIKNLQLEKDKLLAQQDTIKQDLSSSKALVMALRKKEELYATKLVEQTAEREKLYKHFKKTQKELEERLMDGAKEYAKLYLKLQR